MRRTARLKIDGDKLIKLFHYDTLEDLKRHEEEMKEIGWKVISRFTHNRFNLSRRYSRKTKIFDIESETF